MGKDMYDMAVTNAGPAIKAALTHSPSVILLDMEMPEMDGFKLAELVRMYEGFRTVPILFLTGKDTRRHVVEAVTRDGNDYILKPVNRDILLKRIGRHLNRGGAGK